MSDDNKYLDPGQNPMIRLPAVESADAGEDEPATFDDGRIPMRNYGQEEEASPDHAGPNGEQEGPSVAELEKSISDLMGNVRDGCFEIQVENGGVTPLMSVIRTADGKLEVRTPEGKSKDFKNLTALERKLIQHDLRTRREFWGGQKE